MGSVERKTSPLWWGLAIALVSFFVALLVRGSDFLRAFLAAPGVLALCGMLFQLLRDSLAHERALELQARQQDFALGTATHMADVAYDKHVEFCEAYIGRTNQGLQDLWVHGAGSTTLDFGYGLRAIRLRYRAWLTSEIEDRLIPFEQSLIEVGANRELLADLPTGEERSAVVQAMYTGLKLAIGADSPETDEERARTSAHVIDAIRGILGIRELTLLRQAATRMALNRLTPSP